METLPVRGPKIVSLDIETAPTLAWVWRRFKENVSLDQVESDGFILCAAWKWLGESKIHSTRTDNVLAQDDFEVATELREVLDEADIVVAHNGRKFDIATINTALVKHGLPPPSPYKIVDTLEAAKSAFRFPSNRLDGIAQFLRLGKKHRTNFNLWKRVMLDEHKAWVEMVEYCKQDVALLEKVYLRLRPFIRNHPNVAIYNEVTKRPICSKCGSPHIQWRGKKAYYTATQVKQAFQCQAPKCMAWSRGVRSIPTRLTASGNLLVGGV